MSPIAFCLFLLGFTEVLLGCALAWSSSLLRLDAVGFVGQSEIVEGDIERLLFLWISRASDDLLITT